MARERERERKGKKLISKTIDFAPANWECTPPHQHIMGRVQDEVGGTYLDDVKMDAECEMHETGMC